jgi:peptidoglycan-N-acetylmuramic acid deacetylase
MCEEAGMTLKGRLLYLLACLDIIFIALSFAFGFSSEVCFVSRAAHVETSVYGWYTMPRTDGLQPNPQPELAFISDYDGYWIGAADDKVIYITFDAGYENGNMTPILDALKKHNAPAAFFLVGHYIKSSPALVERMTEEGHLVCSHSDNHKDMAAMTAFDTFRREISGLEDTCRSVTGKEMSKYFRPPEGKFSELCLKYAQKLGYKTVFWSFAYKDWYVDNQPSAQSAMDTIISRTHPGMVALLHATSSTNAAIMDDLLTEWEKMGYRFESLNHLTDGR